MESYYLIGAEEMESYLIGTTVSVWGDETGFEI